VLFYLPLKKDVVLEGLKALKRPTSIRVVLDSQYVKNAFTQGWIISWQKNNWKTSSKEPVKNQELWKELLGLVNIHDVSWKWVKGHAHSKWNNLCDTYAYKAASEKLPLTDLMLPLTI
jgi:ribonuclease HI